MIEFPDSVKLVEVAPRDGLQSFPRTVDTETKIKLIDRLSEAGFPVIEVTGFASPRAIPNLADAAEVVARTQRHPGTRYRALVPNLRGTERALDVGRLDELLGLVTVSREYTRRNQNMTVEDAVAETLRSHDAARVAGMDFVVAVGMSMWCPYDGHIPPDRTIAVVEAIYRGGVRDLYLAGSMGLEDPRHVSSLFSTIRRLFPDLRLGYHVHDLSGQVVACVLAAMDAGVSWFEGAICGIGGGVATARPVGNMASEDLVRFFSDMGIDCGVTLDAALAAARDCATILDVEPLSAVMRNGPRSEPSERKPA